MAAFSQRFSGRLVLCASAVSVVVAAQLASSLNANAQSSHNGSHVDASVADAPSTDAMAADTGMDPAEIQCPDELAPIDREGHCCPTGQRWRNGRCEGTVTQCGAGFVTSNGVAPVTASRGDAGGASRASTPSTPSASRSDAGVANCVPRECESGMERAGDGVHCCFTGQTWSTRERRCTGAEQCPANTERVGRGECVPHVMTAVLRPRSNRATMRFVPGGIFEMGARGSARVVSIAPFWMDRTEVSMTEYTACVRAGICLSISDPYGATGTDGRYPAVNVTHTMARAYCAWKQARLPTEAEWEFAARGSDSRMFPWGDRVADCVLARMQGCGAGPGPVGVSSTGQSPFGLLDLSGNVTEWVMDRGGVSSPMGFERNPVGPTEGSRRVVRGGSFADSASALRTIARRELNPVEARPDVGFRCVITEP